mmetsp:Transcript_39283/g.113593  ORF Transcript_39283/g.113593 Transcript_39283/m.113593 type:complete len:85 (+) Transcript_39283:2706-2960(+)
MSPWQLRHVDDAAGVEVLCACVHSMGKLRMTKAMGKNFARRRDGLEQLVCGDPKRFPRFVQLYTKPFMPTGNLQEDRRNDFQPQ